MKRNLVLVAIGIAVMILALYAFSPLLYDKKVNEDIREIHPQENTQTDNTNKNVPENKVATEEITMISKGDFNGIGGHSGKGTAILVKSNGKYYVRLEDNFEVTNGPDLYVYLGKDNKYDPNALISQLKGNVGGQNYEVPEGVDTSQYREIWIWCKAFSVPFAKAELQ